MTKRVIGITGGAGSGIQCVTRTICPWHVHLPSSKYTHNPGFGGGYPEGSLMMHKTTSDTPHELEISGRRSSTGTHRVRSCATAISSAYRAQRSVSFSIRSAAASSSSRLLRLSVARSALTISSFFMFILLSVPL